jgi:hypothetical protein
MIQIRNQQQQKLKVKMMVHQTSCSSFPWSKYIFIFFVDMVRRHGILPSDLGSDAWSDLTSEFSDTKLRKHPNIRTSTPNITRHSSSLSSKEVGQIRRQLTGLLLLKIFIIVRQLFIFKIFKSCIMIS